MFLVSMSNQMYQHHYCKKSIGDTPPADIGPYRLITSEKKSSRSLADVPSLASLQSESSFRTNDLLWLWNLNRMVPTKLINIGADKSPTMPDLSAFKAHVGHDRKANSIGYLPLIPSSPTNPAVVKKPWQNV